MDRVIEFATNHLYLVSAFVGLLALFVFTELQRGGRRISPQQLSRLVNDGALVIDLRNPPEFREGHITSSRNIPYSQVSGEADSLTKTGKPLIFVCALGQVASMAARTAKQAGATEVYHLGGGISSWRQLGLPLVR